jgi:hypothetical protein
VDGGVGHWSRFGFSVRSSAWTVPIPGPRTTNHDSRTTNHEPRFTNHESRTTNHEPRITTHEPRLTTHEPRLTTHEPRLTNFTASIGRGPSSSLFSSASRVEWCAWPSERPSCAPRASAFCVLPCRRSSSCQPRNKPLSSEALRGNPMDCECDFNRNRLDAADKGLSLFTTSNACHPEVATATEGSAVAFRNLESVQSHAMTTQFVVFHGTNGDHILDIIRDGSMRPDSGHEIYFSAANEDVFAHGADRKRNAAFGLKVRITLPAGASQRRENRPGNPQAIIVTSGQPVPAEVLELYVRAPGASKYETIQGVESIKAFLLRR